MVPALSRSFGDFDRGTISRRQLMRLLGAAVASATLPKAAFSQGICSGDRAGTPACNTKPLPPPFEATGWKTVLLDHFMMQVAELDKEAAFYNALMGWQVRSNDGKTIVMDIGDWGGVVMHGGLPFPAPTPTPPPQTGLAAAAASAQDLATRLAGLATAEANRGAGGRGGGRGTAGGGNAAAGGQRGGRGGGVPRVIWSGFAWGIAPWDTRTVEAALKSRGLNPIADHNPQENYFAFKIKDPDGFDVSVTNGNRQNRRTTPAAGELNMAPPFEATGWKTLYLDHISFNGSSYKETAAFYQALLGWSPGEDEGSLVETTVAPEIGGLLIRSGRGGNALDPDFKLPNPRSARIDHIAFGIADFDPDKVRDQLYQRGLTASVDTGAVASSPPAEHDIHTSTYKSYHTNTPNGFNLQISNRIGARNIVLG